MDEYRICMDLSNRRRHPRFLAWLNASLLAQGREPVPATVVDISASGALLQSSQALEIGSRVIVILGQGEKRLPIRGHVIDRSEGPGDHLHIEFAEKQPEGTPETLARLLAALERRTAYDRRAG